METWKSLSYIQKGISHNKANSSCQDSVEVFENANCLVAALADGLGSLDFSQIAAEILTKSICKYFSKKGKDLNNRIVITQFNTLQQNIKDSLLQYIQDCIRREADRRTIPVSSMDCTCVFVCVLKEVNLALVGRLGDSAVCIIRQYESEVLNDNNTTANGTNAIFDENAESEMSLNVYDLSKDPIQGFILTSDGLENELYIKGSAFVNKNAEFYFNAWNSGSDPVEIVKERIRCLTQDPESAFDDDISLAILSRAQEPVLLQENPTWLCSCGERNLLQNTYCHTCHKDFAMLYQNIRFREHGGKAAYFKNINKNPEFEKSLVGIQDVKEEKAVAVSIPEDDTIKPTSSYKPRILFVVLASLIVGLVAGYLIASASKSKKTPEQEPPILPDKANAEQHPQSFHQFEEGDLYWGNLDMNGLPNGAGILISDNICYCGNFNHGLKDGIFTVIGIDNTITSQKYYNNKLVYESTENYEEEGIERQ